jgi:hypothetical protein
MVRAEAAKMALVEAIFAAFVIVKKVVNWYTPFFF